MDLSVRHYLRGDVEEEISKFCSGRWVAVECYPKDGRRVFYRYREKGVPLTINEPADLKKIISRLGSRKPRTIYGSANIYRKLEHKEDVSARENILMSTPSWDLDGSLEEVHLIMEAAEILVDLLRKEGVEKSVYLIWSGRGLHVHVNEKAVSEEIWKKDALRVSFSIVEYILRAAKDELQKICERSRAPDRRLKAENVMDIQRVFTAPLSLHRELDLVAVTINPDEIEKFDLEWTKPERFKYWKNWDRFESGEADKLALKALSEIKGDERTRASAEEPGKSEHIVQRLRSVGRFQIMGLLQAARYYALKGDLNLAKSFGLNRAIFYAWAKKRGITARKAIARSPKAGKAYEHAGEMERLGDEVAYKASGGFFMIGDQVQRPGDFDRQIAARFGRDFERYWRAAVNYVKSLPEDILKSQRGFYEKAYLPVRDNPEKILKHGENHGQQP